MFGWPNGFIESMYYSNCAQFVIKGLTGVSILKFVLSYFDFYIISLSIQLSTLSACHFHVCTSWEHVAKHSSRQYQSSIQFTQLFRGNHFTSDLNNFHQYFPTFQQIFVRRADRKILFVGQPFYCANFRYPPPHFLYKIYLANQSWLWKSSEVQFRFSVQQRLIPNAQFPLHSHL